ncbi:MAG: ABC transporter permease subunit [Frankiales bacterium]|nr:ABC transporter permease subunit [Frankiales bacterium]
MALLTDAPSHSAAPGRRSGRLSPGVRYALRRTLTAISTLVFVVLFNFFLFRVMPGDPIGLYTRGRNVDADQIRALREALDKPLIQQLFEYLKNPFSQGVDSVKYSQPVWDVIGPRVWPTLLLVGSATVIATVVGVWLGIRSGWRRGGRFDTVATNVTLVLYSMPEFWFGMIMLIVFAVGVGPIPGIFPIGGLSTPGVDTSSPAGWLDVAFHLVLPVTTLAVIYLAEYSLIMRASIIEETSQDYLQTARAKGLMDKRVRQRHAVPNALLPTMTLVFLNLGFVVGGAITIEYVFSIDGLGSLTVDALQGPDVPLLQALFLLFSAAVIFANLVADLMYGLLDPRVRT